MGQLVLFANTKTERLAVSDSRLSIEERYVSEGEYAGCSRGRGHGGAPTFLLIEGYDRMVETALQKGTDVWKTPQLNGGRMIGTAMDQCT